MISQLSYEQDHLLMIVRYSIQDLLCCWEGCNHASARHTRHDPHASKSSHELIYPCVVGRKARILQHQSSISNNDSIARLIDQTRSTKLCTQCWASLRLCSHFSCTSYHRSCIFGDFPTCSQWRGDGHPIKLRMSESASRIDQECVLCPDVFF